MAVVYKSCWIWPKEQHNAHVLEKLIYDEERQHDAHLDQYWLRVLCKRVSKPIPQTSLRALEERIRV